MPARSHYSNNEKGGYSVIGFRNNTLGFTLWLFPCVPLCPLWFKLFSLTIPNYTFLKHDT
jgi:hypothetical protein